MIISKARSVAFDVLLRVAGQDAYADEALRSALRGNVKESDAALATELSLGVLRWQRLLDFAIDSKLAKASKPLDIEVRIALRLGAYQLLFLDRVPARAAVNESVELVKRARKSSAASLVNAILRKIADAAGNRKGPPGKRIRAEIAENLEPAERLGIQYSHPTWLVDRWLRSLGEERTRALLASNNRAPTLSAYLLDEARRDEAAQALYRTGCSIRPGHLLRTAWIVEGGNPGASEAVKNGWVAIQDEASQTVAHLVRTQPGHRVLDLCAAPGGKTLILAKAAGAQGHVTAVDLHEHRASAMRERFTQARLQHIEVLTLDATRPLPFERPFDRILVDVPCSGTGTLARHPEIRWKLRPEDLVDLHGRQVKLLRNALPHLAAGGRLVYSTCSLEPEENEFVLAEVLGELNGTYHIVSAREDLEALLLSSVDRSRMISPEGFFRTISPEHDTDGFFAAIIARR